MEKTIQIDGRDVKFKATASMPRLYRATFGCDIIRDVNMLDQMIKKMDGDENQLSVMDLTIFENMAYIMAKQADPENVPNTQDEWLDEFSMFSIYEILPEIAKLWAENMRTTVKPKKKAAPPRAH